MSDNWITVIPEDPRFVPDKPRQEIAVEWFRRVAPDSEEIEVKVSDQIMFFDCGANFSRVVCPSCHAEIQMEWWRERMDEDQEDGFRLLKFLTPCCRAPVTLHELVYEWAQGFGRFAIDVMNPGIGRIDDCQRQELERILGTRIRIIYQHI